LGTTQEFLVMHDLEICCLDEVVSIDGVRDPVFTVVVSTSCYLHFISYVVTLASFCTIGLDWRRLSSSIVSWIWSSVPLDVGSISYVVDDVDVSIGRSVCWRIIRRVGWSISCNVGSGVDWLHYFVFASSVLGH
jgi:hypothetical protein